MMELTNAKCEKMNQLWITSTVDMLKSKLHILTFRVLILEVYTQGMH